LKAADTSVVVAAFASWHASHGAARRALDGGLRLIEHCALETYSVLTRLPAPHRTSGVVVREFLQSRFPEPFLRLSASAYRDFVLGLADASISGGAAYDGLVAATAAYCGTQLVTCDRRALPVYERFGVRTQFLAA
jgi:predicted nucleic acid-binding protein